MPPIFCCLTGTCDGHPGLPLQPTDLTRALQRLYQASCDDPGLQDFHAWDHVEEAAAYLARQKKESPHGPRPQEGADIGIAFDHQYCDIARARLAAAQRQEQPAQDTSETTP